jgi:hypothetical protein
MLQIEQQEKTPELNIARLGIISSQVPDSPFKIFCGGLPYVEQDCGGRMPFADTH